MTTTLLTDEVSNHKVAAVFPSADAALQAQRDLPGRFGLAASQVLVVAPGEPFPGKVLEPEDRGIWRTIVVAHLRLGIAGGIAGLALFALLYLLGIRFITQSPVAAALVALGFGLTGGLLLGGLVSLRPDQDRYVLAAREAMDAGKPTVVVHAFSRGQQEQAAEWLRARGAEITTTL